MTENIVNDTENQNVEMTAGEMLKNARTTGRRKREIQTIAKQLCIREEFLQALEDCDYASLPEPVYILGFARNYAMELGLNPDDVVAKIKQEMGLVLDDVSDVENQDKQIHTTANSGAKLLSTVTIFVRRKWKWFVGGIVAGAVLVALVMALGAIFGGKKAESNTDVTVAETVQAVVEPKYAKAVRERFGEENREKANVVLQATQDGWVKVEDARGNTVFSRVLVAGDVYYVPAGTGYKATFGNAGGIDIWADGALMEKVGESHTRKSDISLNVDSLKPAKETTADAE